MLFETSWRGAFRIHAPGFGNFWEELQWWPAVDNSVLELTSLNIEPQILIQKANTITVKSTEAN